MRLTHILTASLISGLLLSCGGSSNNNANRESLSNYQKVATATTDAIIAEAGPSQESDPFLLVPLFGSADIGDEEGSVQFEWSQITGPDAFILNPRQPDAEILIPGVETTTFLRFRLSATLEKSGQDSVTNSDTMAIIINPLSTFLSVTSEPTNENEDSLDFTVRLSSPATESLVFNYETISRTANSDVDFQGQFETLTFNVGQQEQTISITLIDNQIEDGDRYFALEVSDPASADSGITPALGFGVVVDDESPGSRVISPEPVLAGASDMAQSELEGTVGTVRANLKWTQTDSDLDIQIIDPCGNLISFGSRTSDCQNFLGQLDVDSADAGINTTEENIFWETGSPVGNYTVQVVHFAGAPTDYEARVFWGDVSELVTGSITHGESRDILNFDFTDTQQPTAGVNVFLEGSGQVTTSPGNIDCPEICDENVTVGTIVQLTATPLAGWQFDSWSGDPDCEDGEFTVPVNGISCGAVFVIAQTATVSTDISGSGQIASTPDGIICPEVCSNTFDLGSTVQLNPIPEEGWIFDSWSGDTDCDDGSVTVIAGDVACTAVFIPDLAEFLSVSVDGNGQVTSTPAGIDCPNAFCEVFFDAGTTVTLTPIPDPGWQFESWAGDDDCADGIITMPNGANCQAVFITTSATFDLTVTLTGGPGAGEVFSADSPPPPTLSCINSDTPTTVCTETFDANTRVPLNASPFITDTSAAWEGCDITSQGSCEVVMDSDRNVTVNFINAFIKGVTMNPTFNFWSAGTQPVRGSVSVDFELNEIFYVDGAELPGEPSGRVDAETSWSVGYVTTPREVTVTLRSPPDWTAADTPPNLNFYADTINRLDVLTQLTPDLTIEFTAPDQVVSETLPWNADGIAIEDDLFFIYFKGMEGEGDGFILENIIFNPEPAVVIPL